MRMDTFAIRRRFGRLSALLALVLAAAAALIAPSTCAACSCIVQTFDEAVERAEVIFVGTVTARADGPTSEFGPTIEYTFAVSEVYAGSAPAEAVVRTADNSAACGFAFEEGATYLVMAQSGAAGLETDLCTGTALVSDVAEADLESLGTPSAPSGAAPGSSGSTGGGGSTGEASGPGRTWLVAGGAGLGALLAGALLWWQRRRQPGDPTGAETRRTSPGEALPHTEAT